jgi:ribosome maturation factor RimP
MSDYLVKHWIGQNVTVTLRLEAPTKVRGVIAHADNNFMVLEQGSQPRLLIPFSSILYVEDSGSQP